MGDVELRNDPRAESLIVDGSTVWVRFENSPPFERGWKFEIQGPPSSVTSELHPKRPRLDFIGGSKGGDLSTIKDTVTGREVFRFPQRYTFPARSRWDGRYLVACYKSGELLILDFNNMIPQ